MAQANLWDALDVKCDGGYVRSHAPYPWMICNDKLHLYNDCDFYGYITLIEDIGDYTIIWYKDPICTRWVSVYILSANKQVCCRSQLLNRYQVHYR